jgi:hypothetical protein
MLEQIGDEDIVVQNYTNNFDIKEYIQDELIPAAFPDISVSKLNLGFTGIISEFMSQVIEDSQATASLMMNESFITRAVLQDSIYSEASLFDLGYSFAVPSRCNFAVQLWIEDILKYAKAVKNTSTMRYCLDKDTKVVLGDNTYKFDYDVYIDFQYIDGKRVYNVYYNIEETNSISIITNKYIKHQVTSIGWLVLFVELQEFDRKVETNSITDNLVTVNSDISLKWTRQIAGIDLIYITPGGDRQTMTLKNIYTKAQIDPFAWYKFKTNNEIVLSFSNNKGYFAPAFNSKIESTIYTCNGASSNFDEYDNKSGLPVQKTGSNYSYNANTKMVALCYGGSTGGADKGDIELLRDDVILAHNTANAISTDHDLELWFNNYAKRYNTKAEFFKRRDDPTGRLFSQFICIVNDSYIYPTNTLSIDISQSDCDFVNTDSNGIANEFIIKPGHLWEYADNGDTIVRDRLRMITSLDGAAMVTDDALPQLNSNRQFMFVNPFYIKISRSPAISAMYNCLIDHTSYPEDVPVTSESFYQFQLATFSIERTMSKKYNNKYKIQVICVPVITTDTDIDYVAGIGTEDYPLYENNLRMILVTRSASDGETGYIEMEPVEFRTGSSILFETYIAVHDNIDSDMMLEIDMDKTTGIRSLIQSGTRKGKVYIDAQETSFHFICLIKDFDGKASDPIYSDSRYSGYLVANRFANSHRDLTLYKSLSMMRSNITFAGDNGNYNVRASLIPMLRYDIPLDDTKMAYFIRAFNDQYTAMEPVINKLDGNCSIDFKLYNTYGRSSNYYIGPSDDSDNLYDSNILLDNVYVNIRLVISVYDRSLYTQTVANVTNDIISYINDLSDNDETDLHVSDLIHDIIENQPNVRYLRFLGFNDYDANKQSIFVKYDDISELDENQLQCRVPELIRVDSDSIEITEET